MKGIPLHLVTLIGLSLAATVHSQTAPVVTNQPLSKSINVGQSASFNIGVTGSQPLALQWRKNGVSVVGATNSLLIFTNAQRADAAFYDVVITNSFGALTSSVVSLTVNLVIPDSFNPGIHGIPLGFAIQPDAKILVIGNFSYIAGQNRYNNSRLNSDGTFDWSFFASGADNPIYAVALATNGYMFFGGQFYLFGGVDRPYLIQVPPYGGVDGTFGTWPNATVRALAIQPDGKLLVGGDFSSIGGVARSYLARLNPDNSVDPTFNPVAGNSVYSLALQSDEKILVGGTFTTMAGAAQTNLARLNSDGTLDPSFNATTLGLPDVLLVQPDGKILVGGDFFNTPVGVNYCRRLNADGGLDTTFNSVLTDAAFPSVYALALQTDGSILIGGIFDTLGGVPRSNFGRLSKDGSTDLNFDPGGGAVHSLALQPDGRVLFGSPTDLGRLLNTDPATDDLSFDNSSVTWTRSGSAPEVWYVAFEVTTNGEDWLNLGRGTRITGGWQSTGRSLPSPPAIIRARGFVTGGNWFDEKLAGPPIITSQPASMTVNAVTRVNFSVAVTGPVPLTYQWLKNGTNFDPENGSGAQSPYLTLTNLLGSDSGQYQLVVSDSWGSVTSLVANLVVKDPILTSQPSGFATNVGQTVVFSVGAAGTLPLIYQWYKNGTALPNSTTSLLALTNIYGSDAANYFAIVTNQYGARTSSIVSLSVNLALPDTFGPNPGIVSALAVQGDGKILLAPNSPATDQIFTRSPLRYNFDGSLDSTFDAGISNRAVNCLMIQTDGKILVAGSPLDSAHYLWRLNVDGSVDTAFTNSAPQLSGPPNSLALQPDGKILLGGNFSIGTPAICTNLARLNPDGTLDSNFLAGANGPVKSIALQPDGAVLAAGAFSVLNGQGRGGIGRFNRYGLLDTNFNATVNWGVNCLVIQPDGKILIGGNYALWNGTPIAIQVNRLNQDGTLDAAFNYNLKADGNLVTLALQADGKILFGGGFTSFAGQTRNNLGRLNADGSIDTAFFPTVNSNVQALVLQPDGAVLVGGLFSNISGQLRNGFARLTPSDPGAQYLSCDGQTITWLRCGTTPEVWRTTFETSSDGTNWTTVGAGFRVSGGWQLTGLSLPANTLLRARGFATGAYYQGSGWYVESLAHVLSPPPSILTNDAVFGFRPDHFGFSLSAVPGQALVIEASTDLVHWLPIQTNLVPVPSQAAMPGNSGVLQAGTGLVAFTDSQASLASKRFYRALLYSPRWTQ